MAPTNEWTVDAAATTPLSVRATFIKRTYGHLLGAVMAFVILELLLFRLGIARSLTEWFISIGRGGMFGMVGGFVLVSWLASRFALGSDSRGLQYVGLFGYVAALGIFLTPMLFYAHLRVPGGITSAAVITGIGFAGLTAVVLLGKGDFSFLGSLLKWAGVVAVLAIIGSLAFGFTLGMGFSVLMVAFAGAAILHDTSNVLHHYRVDQYVGAALALFSSVVLMFVYVLRIILDRR